MAERENNDPEFSLRGVSIEHMGADALVGFEIEPHSERGEENAEKFITGFAKFVDGQVVREVDLNQERPRGSFTTGFGGKHPLKATWQPAGSAWRNGRKTDD